MICDRLELLNDSFAAKHLKVAAKVSMQVSTKDSRKISGRADWALGYMDEKDKLQEMLVVIEAKSRGILGVAIPQLLIYLAGIQDARATAEKVNTTVFGIATDSDQFIFAILQGDRKAYVSKPVDWIEETDLVISFLDCILQNAIESSPPIRTNNKTIKKFEESLSTTYVFNDSERIHIDDNNLAWNVVEVNGVSLLRPCGDVDNEIIDEYTQIL